MSETYVLQKGKYFDAKGQRINIGEKVVLTSSQAKAFSDMFVKESVLKAQSVKDVNLTLEEAKRIIAEDEAKKKAAEEEEAKTKTQANTANKTKSNS